MEGILMSATSPCESPRPRRRRAWGLLVVVLIVVLGALAWRTPAMAVPLTELATAVVGLVGVTVTRRRLDAV